MQQAMEDKHRQHVAQDFHHLFILHHSFIGRHDHQLKYHLPEASVDLYKFSFYPRTVKIWNQLPPAAVCAPTISAFREAALPVIRGLQPPVGSRLL